MAMGGKPRRRIDLALGAWRAVRDLGLQLVVLGQVLPEEKGLHCLGAIDDDELVALMGGASAFLYPTEFEGFGLPALEAAACGTVVVAHPSTSLPEVLPEDAAAWAEALEIDALAAVTRRVLTDDAWADALRERGLRRAAGATWDAAVSAHVRAYREASEA